METAAEVPQAEAAERQADPRRSSVAEWAAQIVLLLFAIAVLFQPFVIPTVSMEDTLLRGDHLLVDKLAYAPAGPVSRHLLPYRDVRRGDIIVFRYPVNIRENYVKRVIGIPGDRLRIVNKQVYLNGKPLHEPYKFHKTAYFDSYRDNFPGEPNVRLPERALSMLEHNVKNGDLVVPEGMYFVMGDNRDNSLDSRYWGFVPRANIIGMPLVIWWSYDAPTERLADPNIINIPHILDLARNFFSKTRWNRTLRFVHPRPIP
ncbi:MAG: signal peptidase I [Acidobacteriota bacterium]